MDSFDLAFLQEWDLDDLCPVFGGAPAKTGQLGGLLIAVRESSLPNSVVQSPGQRLCGYDQDKNALLKKEWERRSQEVQEVDEHFLSNHPLFSEPYKTSKGDELSSRIQSTLGNYDEMKDLLTDRSNQSHLVGIPKTEVSQIPEQKADENFLQLPRESHFSLCGTVQTGNIPLSLPVTVNNRTTMNWQKSSDCSEGQDISSKADQRNIDSPAHDFTSGNRKHVTEKNKRGSLNPASITSTSNDPHQTMLPCTLDNIVNRQVPCSKLNCSLELGISIKDKTCTKTNTGAQNFPPSIVSKSNAVQQKPTAYVRPMDGQDQVPNESPNLKSSSESNILFPLIRGLASKPNCESVQSGKRDILSEPDLEEDNQHNRFSSPKHGDLKFESPTSCAAQISTLADDLKLSSDEEDSVQPVSQGPVIGVQNDSVCSGAAQECSKRASGVSVKGSSSSSSETDTSSESDSESASSSSDSETSKPSGYTSPEPEQPTSNKWQLDKWLNKVNPHKNSILSHTPGLCNGGVKEAGKDCEKVLEECQATSDNKDTGSPCIEDQRPRTTCTIQSNKVAKSVPTALSIPTESTSRRRPVCRKLTRRSERTSGDDKQNYSRSDDICFGQGNLVNNITEKTKNRLICSRGLHRKEPRTATFEGESRRTRGLCRSISKSKEFVESLSQYSDHGTESELEASPLSKDIVANPLTASENTHRSKDCTGNNIIRPNPSNTAAFANSRTTTQDLEELFYTLVPFGRNDSVHSLKGSDEVKSLWVRIDLTLLSRIPKGFPQESLAMNSCTKETLASPQNKALHPGTDSSLVKMRRKRKFENEASHDRKKNCVDMDDSVLPGLSVDSSEVVNRHHTSINSDEISSTSKSLAGSLLPPFVSSSRSRRHEIQSHVRRRSHINPPENTSLPNREDPQSDPWSPPSNGHRDSRRTKLLFDTTPHCADYFMQQAKRMKHKADAMMDKFNKVLIYTEAALSFIECGSAMEHGPMESKSPYTMYSETVELIRYALRLKSHSGPNASTQDKKITALCYRCLALLYWRMFRLKRDHAVKYSKALIDYFKGTTKAPQAPSSNGRIAGAPSPVSPSPSPVSSTGSQGSISSTGAPSSTSIISIPHRIHQMAANHVSITNSILHSYDYWEIADNIAKDNIDFFNELDALMGPVTLHSSMEHLVKYTRQGLHWVRNSVHLL
ncbi:AF4/FMR2 family member 3 [Pelodytes ibericus]